MPAQGEVERERGAYPPLGTLKQVATNIWIVDGEPLRVMATEIPVRMTVVRLPSGAMWLHSPVRYGKGLAEEIVAFGPIRHMVAPNSAHWLFIKGWQEHYPEAIGWAIPGLEKRAQVRRAGVVFERTLADKPPVEWEGDLDQAIVPGGFGFGEAVFFHRRTRTAILTDLIENFEREKLSPFARPIVRLLGAMAPHGKAPAYLRFVINRRRKRAREAARRIIGWQPERVIFAHGRWFASDGAAQLRQSFRWLLDEGAQKA
jgi:hypothetical protein